MKCEELLKMLNDYIDEDIDSTLCDRFEEHLKGCNSCKVVVDNIKKTITLYKDNEKYEIPLEVHRKLHKCLQEKWKELKGG